VSADLERLATADVLAPHADHIAAPLQCVEA
jgi:hypothetical protein